MNGYDVWFFEFDRFFVFDPNDEMEYLVDLSEPINGWCGCADFSWNVSSENQPGRTLCEHIVAARLYQDKLVNENRRLLKPFKVA